MVVGQSTVFFTEPGNLFWKILLVVGGLIYVSLLITALLYPMFRKKRDQVVLAVHPEPAILKDFVVPVYRNIAIAIELGTHDDKLIAHAISQGKKDTSFILIHVVESATAKVMGEETDDLETHKDQEKLNVYARQLQQKGYSAITALGFGNRTKEIPKLVKESNADLLVIGAHGHAGLKDWLYGATIDAVRHQLKIPVLIVNV